MVDTISDELTSVIEELRKELASVTGRLARLEQSTAVPAAPAAAAAPLPASVPAPAAPVAKPAITPGELLAISAAIAAYLGVRVHIRQIRLISSRAWAQEGRVSIQASHRLHK